jgi:predicted DNA-binding transcriptional regulator AlpA
LNSLSGYATARVSSMRDKDYVLPSNLAPRGLSRAQAAAYIGVSPSLFDEMVRDGRMPKPKRINSRTIWDRIRLDDAFAAISDFENDGDDPWGKVAL